MNINRRELLRLTALSALSPNSVTALADSWPARLLRIVHGYDSGSNPDTISRIIGPALSERLGQPIIVEAKPGAAGRIAARYVATQPADGYTLLMLTAGDAVVAALDSRVQYKLLRDFAFVSSVIEFPFLLCVSADSPIKSFADLLFDAKRRPGQLSYGTPGLGTTHSVAGELLQKMAGIGLLHVPYKGNAFPDLLGGRVDVLIATPSVSLPMILGGKVRGIAVTSKAALPALPEVPPVARLVPEYEVNSWLGLAVPNGTPNERVQQLSAGVQAAAAVEQVRRALGATGSMVAASSSDAFRDRVERDVRKWATLSDRVKLDS
jgi:tripartite-type tricarboxylate transporter receptor subunit TctC